MRMRNPRRMCKNIRLRNRCMCTCECECASCYAGLEDGNATRGAAIIRSVLLPPSVIIRLSYLALHRVRAALLEVLRATEAHADLAQLGHLLLLLARLRTANAEASRALAAARRGGGGGTATAGPSLVDRAGRCGLHHWLLVVVLGVLNCKV